MGYELTVSNDSSWLDSFFATLGSAIAFTNEEGKDGVGESFLLELARQMKECTFTDWIVLFLCFPIFGDIVSRRIGCLS